MSVLFSVIFYQVIKESGPPHMKTFVTRCSCGDIVTEGEGNSKKLSKKRSAEKMLNDLNTLPPLTTTVNKTKKNTIKKKNSRNLIKVIFKQMKPLSVYASFRAVYIYIGEEHNHLLYFRSLQICYP